MWRFLVEATSGQVDDVTGENRGQSEEMAGAQTGCGISQGESS